MNITDEILSAYLDGELSVDEIAQVALEIENSPALAEHVENMRLNDKSIARTYHAIDTKPMPAGIMGMLEDFPEKQRKSSGADEATVLPFNKKQPVRLRKPVWQMAMAATILLFMGFGAGRSLMAPSSSSLGDISAQLDSEVIGSENILFSVLENQPSASPVVLSANNEITVMPSMTFRTTDDRYCREYRVSRQKSSSQSVACRSEGAWIVQLSVETPGSISSDDGLYQTASQMDNPLIDSAIQGLIAGDALSADDEVQIMKQNWHQK